MTVNRYVLLADVTIPWPATWAELVNGGFVNSAGTVTVGTSPGPEAIQVSASGPAGGQAGTIPQTTFLQGTPLWLDPSGLLYAAIGSSNLRAWIDGTDVTGHGHWACLGN